MHRLASLAVFWLASAAILNTAEARPSMPNIIVILHSFTSVIDVFPTFAEMAGVTLEAKVKAQVEGRSLVRGATGWQLFDLMHDPGQTNDIAARQPDVVKAPSSAYDQWWIAALPDLVNEDAYKAAPKINSFREEYWKQSGGGSNSQPNPEKSK